MWLGGIISHGDSGHGFFHFLCRIGHGPFPDFKMLVSPVPYDPKQFGRRLPSSRPGSSIEFCLFCFKIIVKIYIIIV